MIANTANGTLHQTRLDHYQRTRDGHTTTVWFWYCANHWCGIAGTEDPCQQTVQDAADLHAATNGKTR